MALLSGRISSIPASEVEVPVYRTSRIVTVEMKMAPRIHRFERTENIVWVWKDFGSCVQVAYRVSTPGFEIYMYEVSRELDVESGVKKKELPVLDARSLWIVNLSTAWFEFLLDWFVLAVGTIEWRVQTHHHMTNSRLAKMRCRYGPYSLQSHEAVDEDEGLKRFWALTRSILWQPRYWQTLVKSMFFIMVTTLQRSILQK